MGVRSGNPRVVAVPKGVDVGFTPHNFDNIKAGRNASIDSVLMQKLTTAAPKFASLLIDDILTKRPQAVQMLNAAMKDMVEAVASEKIARGNLKYVGVLPSEVIDKLATLHKAPQSAVIAVRDDDILHALRDSKQAKGINLPTEFWEKLPEKLRNPSAILLEREQKIPTLLFVFQTGKGKVVVKLDYEVQLKELDTKKKYKTKLNLVRTASVLEEFTGVGRFEVLWGKL